MPTVEVETDHKPLEAILKKPFHQAPVRLQRMIITILKYSINLIYRPGKTIVIAGTLFHACLLKKFNSCVAEKIEINVLLTLPISDTKYAQLNENISADSELQQLMNLTADGWPTDMSQVPAPCLP